MIIVKTIERFSDLKEKVIRELNDEFEVTQKRFDELKALELVEAAKVHESTEKKRSSKKKKGDY